jgi:hypothetical protein
VEVLSRLKENVALNFEEDESIFVERMDFMHYDIAGLTVLPNVVIASGRFYYIFRVA